MAMKKKYMAPSVEMISMSAIVAGNTGNLVISSQGSDAEELGAKPTGIGDVSGDSEDSETYKPGSSLWDDEW